ncbi:hypothetical protein HDU79_001838, partial [Rhizoclosmatium sp. JEL0117]
MSLCPSAPTSYNPFLLNGARVKGKDWILPTAAELRPFNLTAGPKPGYGCFKCPDSPIGIPMLSNTSSNAPRTIETLCPRGFFCPYLDVSNPVTWPVYCEPSAECLFRRLGTGELCDSPQGYYEPYVCPGGFYCPTAKEIVVCPAGSYCLTGSSAPVKCMFGSYCPTGSAVEKHYGFLLLVVAIDVLIAAIFLFYRLRELKANNEPISALIPYALQKAYIDFSNRYLKKKEYEKTATSEIDTQTLIP